MMSNNLGMLAEVNPRYIGSYKSSNKLISMFGRATYNYNSKYYLTGTLRRDGSTKFGKNNEWGLFPSVSTAWNIKEENFLVDFNHISMLKLRVGYGLVGNQEIGNYLDIMTATAVGTTIDPETGLPTIEFQLSHNANPDLKWEENREVNIGLDFGVLNNRVSGSFDFYDKMTYDLLAPYDVPVPPNALRTTWANVGTIRNRGVELQLQAFVMDDRAFKWKTIYTFSKNKQTVEELSNDFFSWTERKEGWLSGRGLVGDENWTQMIRPGWALGTFYMPEYAGLSADGKFLFFTAAGGVTRDVSKAERRVVGTAQPKFEMGWSNFFTIYKNLDVSFALRWVHGFDVLNVTRMVFENPSVIGTLNGLNSVADEIERGVTDFPKVNSYYLEDGSFLRMDNITVGYSFDVSKIKWLGKARLYASTNNLFIITGYSGLDPEISYGGLSFGLDQYNVYPKTRNFTAGVNITF
jgi:iron complex outermembrane receptor protein